MDTILVLSDGSEPAMRALDWAIKTAKLHNEPTHVCVLNIQSPIISNNVARFFSSTALQSFYDDEAAEALEKAKVVLTATGLDYTIHNQVGRIERVIPEYLEKNHCTQITMGTRGLGAVPGLLLGSTATKVLSVATVPVTLVK